jgi:hypothetical protein
MQLSVAQQYALTQMGIPVWVERNEVNLNSNEQPAVADDLSHIDFTKPWTVITGKALSIAESRLLRAMFKSIDIQLNDVAFIEQQPTIAVIQSFAAHTIVLILDRKIGETLSLQPHSTLACQQFNNGTLALAGDSLQQLLAEPERKATMWQTLMKLRNLKALQLD